MSNELEYNMFVDKFFPIFGIVLLVGLLYAAFGYLFFSFTKISMEILAGFISPLVFYRLIEHGRRISIAYTKKN